VEKRRKNEEKEGLAEVQVKEEKLLDEEERIHGSCKKRGGKRRGR